MSLLIKGMDMPESCRHCRFCVAEDTNDDYSPYYCVINPYLRWSTSVDIPDYVSLGCNSFEIPTPHGRLIDADKLRACLNALEYIAHVEGGRPTFEEALEEIAKAPTVIEAEE